MRMRRVQLYSRWDTHIEKRSGNLESGFGICLDRGGGGGLMAGCWVVGRKLKAVQESPHAARPSPP